MPVQIHNKQYVTVAERVQEADKDFLSLNTEVLAGEPVVVIKATVTTSKGTFTGISAANPAKLIEKQNPYEVAETSAVGRALGFAGYGIVEGIASADEMVKATSTTSTKVTSSLTKKCEIHDKPLLKVFNPHTSKTEYKHSYPLEKDASGNVTKWDACKGFGWESQMNQDDNETPEYEPDAVDF